MYELHSEIHDWLYTLPQSVTVELLLSALDHMSYSNTQSMATCIMLAAGAEETEKGWKRPTLAELTKTLDVQL